MRLEKKLGMCRILQTKIRTLEVWSRGADMICVLKAMCQRYRGCVGNKSERDKEGLKGISWSGGFQTNL